MSTPFDSVHAEAETPQNAKAALLRHKRYAPLFWGAFAFILIVAVWSRLYDLNVPFDRVGYDEGVYWQSLRAMSAGQGLYSTIFYSQPPVFLLSIFPTFVLFGQSLWSARFGIALISLFGFLGAYLLGRSLSGRFGALVALLLLLLNPLYLAESQTIQAEGPSVALTLLAIGFAFLWWQQPDGRRGTCWASLAGITVALSIFSKLLSVPTIVPLILLVIARSWQIWRKYPGTNAHSWLPVGAGVGLALLTSLVVVLPFLSTFQNFWASVVSFHEITVQDIPVVYSSNEVLQPVLFSFLSATAIYGTLIALLRKDWRALPLLAWLLVTLILLLRQYPLYPHHTVALIPPFIALAVLSVARPGSYKTIPVNSKRRRKAVALFSTVLPISLVLLTTGFNMVQDVRYYLDTNINSTSVNTQQALRAANDLRQAIAPDQWVVTDGQFVAGLADRSTPPSLVDTSNVRISTGYVTLKQLEQSASDPRVHAVLFFTYRFDLPNINRFHAWVAQRFHLIHTYGPGQELWVR
ncbi:MAG TPA: glycosyltransferase family 39 protein [Ktedonobacteraceae bacterium]|nr:glycosyltransferase family 39 protein [Ktedonobacteraceae bacterium]